MYADAQTLVAASSVEELLQLTDDEQEKLRRTSIRAVEAFCGQRFDARVATRVLDGDGSGKLALDERLAAITGLALPTNAASSLDLSDVALSDKRDVLYVTADAGSGGTWATRVLRQGLSPVFPTGSGTVSITGTWGWLDSEMPATVDTPVGIALLLDMEDQAKAHRYGLATQVRAQTRLGVRSVSQGPLSFSQQNSSDVSLPLEAQEALADLIWQPVHAGA